MVSIQTKLRVQAHQKAEWEKLKAGAYQWTANILLAVSLIVLLVRAGILQVG